MKVYVVISDSIINNYSSHGLHGVYQNKASAKTSAISAITSMANAWGHNVTIEDITTEEDDFFYNKDGIDIVVSCIEEDLL